MLRRAVVVWLYLFGDIHQKEVVMTKRTINFVGAGEQDISEVTISTGTHPVTGAPTTKRVTYTISYPEADARNPLTIQDSFAEAAKAIVADAQQRGVDPGQE